MAAVVITSAVSFAGMASGVAMLYCCQRSRHLAVSVLCGAWCLMAVLCYHVGGAAISARDAQHQWLDKLSPEIRAMATYNFIQREISDGVRNGGTGIHSSSGSVGSSVRGLARSAGDVGNSANCDGNCISELHRLHAGARGTEAGPESSRCDSGSSVVGTVE